MRQVRVQLTTAQQQDGDMTTTETTAIGCLSAEGNTIQLRYTEPPCEESAGATVCVTAMPARVTIERCGEFRSRLLFVPGQRCLCSYDTPYGSLSLHTQCQRLENEWRVDGGRLFIAYAMETGAAEPLSCTAEFLVEEVSE